MPLRNSQVQREDMGLHGEQCYIDLGLKYICRLFQGQKGQHIADMGGIAEIGDTKQIASDIRNIEKQKKKRQYEDCNIKPSNQFPH